MPQRFCGIQKKDEDGPRQTVAILGASTNRAKYGNKAVRAHCADGWEVFPVNPRAERIEGIPAYHSLADLPARPQRISVYLPAKMTLAMVDAIAAVGADEVFLNPGAESDELVAALRAAGVEPIQACSILAVGQQPDDFDEA